MSRSWTRAMGCGLFGVSIAMIGCSVMDPDPGNPTDTSEDGVRRHHRDAGVDASQPDASLPDASIPPDAPSGGGSTGLTLYDNFNGALYNITSDGALAPDGKWRVGFLGYGFAKTVQDPSNSANDYLVMSPKLDTLRAARFDTTQTWQGIHGRLRARLDIQLQPPVGWYTLWPLIAFVDDTTSYYFNLKTNGWELGKKDNDHPPAEELQEYLRTGTSPTAAIGQWNTIEWWVVKDTASANLRIRVDVNGATVVDMVDNQPWQRNGTTGTGASAYFLTSPKKVALYNEGSQVSWDDVYLSEATTIP